ncbi:TnsA-like heteromeric transposase endonuclease subunit [Streptomyces sp. 71268]|uniref:TnsA-like heteromeric transposase endonuclease subunit n=1 Tax=Streptomyces sp. 71268 TaxID=3002640 RepID=UPI0023F94AF9|nr:TnsA-like heteromeric transposase endonuclease subunit [Streptomyces sp. 71268]WEV23759.1 TnsA-like heteromeric transposase endonuclease subunit [Streptomyces sp. 71268]WEV29538.1 TnsA-like heteromeric transposase endonuclease subunit [Streptomyces sp. 71268]
MRAQLMVLDRDPDVTGRPGRLLWRNRRGQVRSWAPQLFARRSDGAAPLADCPGHSGGERAVKASEAVTQACADIGWIYRRIPPLDDVLAANLKWLAGYCHPRNAGRPKLIVVVVGAFTRPRPLIEGTAAAGDPIEVLPCVFHALWHGRLTADLDTPLYERILVGPQGWSDPGTKRGAGRARGGVPGWPWRVGTRVRFCGVTWQVVALSRQEIHLVSPNGGGQAVLAEHLFTDPDFTVIGTDVP